MNDITVEQGATDALIRKANSDPYIDGFIIDSDDCYTILVNKQPVGLIEIQQLKEYKKVSVVYISPEYKNKGLAKLAINHIIQDEPSFAFVDVKNTISNNLFKSIGYYVDGQREKNGINYNLYVRR